MQEERSTTFQFPNLKCSKQNFQEIGPNYKSCEREYQPSLLNQFGATEHYNFHIIFLFYPTNSYINPTQTFLKQVRFISWVMGNTRFIPFLVSLIFCIYSITSEPAFWSYITIYDTFTYIPHILRMQCPL